MITLSSTILRRKEAQFLFCLTSNNCRSATTLLPGIFSPSFFTWLDQLCGGGGGGGGGVPFEKSFIWIFIAIASSLECQVQILGCLLLDCQTGLKSKDLFSSQHHYPLLQSTKSSSETSSRQYLQNCQFVWLASLFLSFLIFYFRHLTPINISTYTYKGKIWFFYG